MRFPWSLTSRRRQYKPLLQVPFVGRQDVLAALATHLQAAQDGTVQCVTLTGQAGSGKSALLEEFMYLHCSKPGVLLLQLNAADCLLDYDVYRQLCVALQNHSEQILHKVYNATQRVRKTLALHWDEVEFRQVLASTDWAQPHEASRNTPSMARAASTPLAPLLSSVQEHPWAIGAAAILGVSGRGAIDGTMQRFWQQRWRMFLWALRARYRPGEAVIVLVIDHMQHGTPAAMSAGTEVRNDWQTFTTLTAEEQLPLLLMWAGTAVGLQPLHQALRGTMPLTEYHIEPLLDEDQQLFIRQAVRGLPRGLQMPWSQTLMAAGDVTAIPGRCLLATTCAAATVQPPDAQSLASLAQADLATLVSQLVEAIRQRHPVQAPLFRQVLEACAFMPPGKQLVVDDLLPLCDFTGLDLDPATGRAHLEILLGQCARYGLLRYDPYAARYTLGHSAIQDALQGLVYPDVSACQQMARQRRLAAALLLHMQQGERVGLAALAEHIEEAYGGAARELLAPLVAVPFRRLLPTCTREERQRIATTLGGFTSALAVDLIRCLIHDEDGQVRSSAVQSLADLACEEAVPVLLEALQDSNSDVRWIATRALGQRPGTTAVDALIPMLTDEDREVGRVAAEGLGLQGDRRAVPHLIAAIRESYPLLRESAILALGQLADQRAIPALEDVLHDANQQVRRSAEVALARFAASAGLKGNGVPEPWEPHSKQAAFEAVALEHFNTLYSTALRLTRNASEAQDLVQETLLKAYRFFDRFEPGTNVKAWLFTILRNTYINTYRKTVRQQEQVDFERIEPFYADPASDTEWLDQESLESMLHHVVQDDVKQALDALPEAYRLVVLLADMGDLSYKDIAAIIGCPEGTVMSRLFRGRRLLRKSLQEFARKGGYVKG